MKLAPSIFDNRWQNRLGNSVAGTIGRRWPASRYHRAALAGFEAGQPTTTRRQQTRYNSNPNSIGAQIERVFASWNAEWLAKNSPFAIGYLRQRINYCTPQGWMPNTGDAALNQEVKAYCEEQWRDMAINGSIYEAVARLFNVETPARGDSAGVWIRDETRLRFAEFAGDQIGELYTFTVPTSNRLGDLQYFSGIYFDRYGIRQAFQLYERGGNQVYRRIPDPFPASDVLYLSDNLFRGVRGMTIFHGTINSLTKSDQLFDFGLGAAQKQAKTGVVVRNEMGAPLSELSYETQIQADGSVVVLERNFDGAKTEYQYNGDSYEVIKTEAPGSELIEGCRYSDERSCQSLGMPYSWLVSGRFDGGAGYRGDVNKASKEIARICQLIEPIFTKIAYVTIMDGFDRGEFRGARGDALANLTRGMVQFPIAPTADAFRDSKDDLMSIWAGTDSYQRVTARYREDIETIADEKMQAAVLFAKKVEDGNKQLVESGYKPTITLSDIAQSSTNPQQSAAGEAIEQGKQSHPSKVSTGDNPPNVTQGKFAAYMGDVNASDLPDDTRDEIARILGTNGDTDSLKLIKYGMVAPELERMADPHNLEAAQKNIRYSTNGSCAEEVHANEDKHVLINNGRIVDGHHFLAKALKGKVSKSLPVIDLTPARFQMAQLAEFDESKHPRGNPKNAGEFGGGGASPKAKSKSIGQESNEAAIEDLKSKHGAVKQVDFPISKLRIVTDSESGRETIEAAKKEIQNGDRHPLVAEKITTGKNIGQYKLTDGNHRAQAYKELGIESAPTVIPEKDASSLGELNPTKKQLGKKARDSGDSDTHNGGITPTKQRAWNGAQVQTKTQLSKLETGAIGEKVAIAYLQSKGFKDARTTNVNVNNFPVDLMQDHEGIEVKTGLVSNSDTAMHWRATIGQPGPEETKLLSMMSNEEKKAHNLKKMSAILERKQKALAILSKESGVKQPFKGKTLTMILNPDTKTADLYEFDGFHLRIPWKSNEAKAGYVGSFKYA